jgi:hypothetical protein
VVDTGRPGFGRAWIGRDEGTNDRLETMHGYGLCSHYVQAAAEAAVVRLTLLTSVLPLGFAAIREHHLAGK